MSVAALPSISTSAGKTHLCRFLGPFFSQLFFGQRCVHCVRISHANFSLDPHHYLPEVMRPVL